MKSKNENNEQDSFSRVIKQDGLNLGLTLWGLLFFVGLPFGISYIITLPLGEILPGNVYHLEPNPAYVEGGNNTYMVGDDYNLGPQFAEYPEFIKIYDEENWIRRHRTLTAIIISLLYGIYLIVKPKLKKIFTIKRSLK